VPNRWITGAESTVKTYPVMIRITIAEAAMTAAMFLKRKSPVNFIFLVKNLGEMWWFRAIHLSYR
jgi:hypothetical protein